MDNAKGKEILNEDLLDQVAGGLASSTFIYQCDDCGKIFEVDEPFESCLYCSSTKIHQIDC